MKAEDDKDEILFHPSSLSSHPFFDLNPLPMQASDFPTNF
jgi:hypothetical protein